MTGKNTEKPAEKNPNGEWRKVIIKDKKYGGIIRYSLDIRVDIIAMGSYVITQTEPSMRKDGFKEVYDNDGCFALNYLHGQTLTPIYKIEGVAQDEFDVVLDFLKKHAVANHLRGVKYAIMEVISRDY